MSQILAILINVRDTRWWTTKGMPVKLAFCNLLELLCEHEKPLRVIFSSTIRRRKCIWPIKKLNNGLTHFYNHHYKWNREHLFSNNRSKRQQATHKRLSHQNFRKRFSASEPAAMDWFPPSSLEYQVSAGASSLKIMNAIAPLYNRFRIYKTKNEFSNNRLELNSSPLS